MTLTRTPIDFATDYNRKSGRTSMVDPNSIQVDALAQLLIEKGIFSEQEFFTKLKMVQMEYESKKAQ